MVVAASASRDRHTWFAQNWDWIGRQRPALVLLRSHDGRGTGFSTLTEAGMLAKIGVNAHGFALGLNILRSRGDGARPGVAVHVLLRHLLSCPTLAQARRVLADLHQRLGFGAASNIPCADATGDVACFEVAPAGWGECRPTDGVVVHSNHFLCAPLLPEQVAPASALSTELRLATAQRHATPRPLDRHGLDGSWERKLAKAQISPDLTLDLHGHSLDAAHARLDAGLMQAVAMGARLLLVITGKPRPVAAADRSERRGAIRAKYGMQMRLFSGAQRVLSRVSSRFGTSDAAVVITPEPAVPQD